MDEGDGWGMMDEGRWGGGGVRLNCVRILGIRTVARSEGGPRRPPQAAAGAAAAAAAAARAAVLLFDKHLTTFSAVKTSPHPAHEFAS